MIVFVRRLAMVFCIPLFFSGCVEFHPLEEDPYKASERHSPYASFYIAAHPDDIELFMGRNAWTDIATPGVKTVFIVLTAGDAGNGTGDYRNGDKSDGLPDHPYYRAREYGHERAIRFWYSLRNNSNNPVPDPVEKYVEIDGKTLLRHRINDDVVFYNLRLLDGSSDGDGYEGDQYQSLKKLRSGDIKHISSIDKKLSLTYDDLKALIQGIITYESHGFEKIWVNIQDEDRLNNPVEHPDHDATAHTVLNALSAPDFKCVNIARYTTYINAVKPQNLKTVDAMIHVGTWGVLNSDLTAHGQATTWDVGFPVPGHNEWLNKMYVRTEKTNASCDF